MQQKTMLYFPKHQFKTTYFQNMLLSSGLLNKCPFSFPLYELHALETIYRTCLNIYHQSNLKLTNPSDKLLSLAVSCHVVQYSIPQTHQFIVLAQKLLQVPMQNAQWRQEGLHSTASLKLPLQHTTKPPCWTSHLLGGDIFKTGIRRPQKTQGFNLENCKFSI